MTSLTDKIEGLVEPINPLFPERCKGHNGAIYKCIALAEAEAAVVGDWEAGFNKKFIGNEMLDLISPIHGSAENIRAYITTLLAAKDRDIVEAYAQGWNEGQIDLSARLKI